MSASANGRDALLEIAGLTAGYGAQPVLHDVSLKVDRNEFVAVIGANTAGKSTLLRAISGLLPRCEGRIAFEGEDLTRLKAHEIAGLGIAHVPEGRHVFPEMTVEENLKKFEKMRTGQYEEGTAFLRMKGDLMSDNPAMWDTAFYRIKYAPHPHSGELWCIYPTYDYTHCIVDSLENITHSLCTLEFETRQAADGPYYWLLHKLGIYKPVTWEYGRCNITYNVLSKRRLNALVTQGHVNGWDDPRLLTLDGLRRRGYTATAINSFCEAIGVTRSGTVTTQTHVLENCIRKEMDETALRAFAVLKPLKVAITNFKDVSDGKDKIEITVPNHPKDPSKGERKLVLASTIYIEQDDYRDKDDKDFYGLAPGKEVGLLGAGMILTCTKKEKDGSLSATVRPRGDGKPKGNLHWVSHGHAVACEMRLYSNLFTVENPMAPVTPTVTKGGAAPPAAEESVGTPAGDEEEEEKDEGAPAWLSLLNPDSLKVESKALIEPSLAAAAATPGKAFQLQRVGYFVVDVDSTSKKPVFNRTVALK